MKLSQDIGGFRALAFWETGKITNGEYADYLEERAAADGEGLDPVTQILIEKLRKDKDGFYREGD